MQILIQSIATALVAVIWSGVAGQASGTNHRCYVGTYLLPDGQYVDVAPSGDADLRWRTLDGRTGRLARGSDGNWSNFLGWTSEPLHTRISFDSCESGKIQFEGKSGKLVELQSVETQFERDGVTFAARLVLPMGEQPVPIVVLGHGSERAPALQDAFRQRLYPAQGVGIFVFDKRGTGKSGGKYTQAFDVLAADMAAAMREARRLGGKRGSRFGFLGGSQAGWVLPLAAQQVATDFVIVGYGVAASPLVEDRTETMQDLAAAGWGGDVFSKAKEVTDATGKVVASRFTQGFGELRAIAAKYQSEPWFKDLDGEFTGEIVKALNYPDEALQSEGQRRDEGTTWKFDALASLRKLRSPLLWMIAGGDTGGAGPETRENLLSLQREGRPITVAIFPGTDHGIHIFRTSADGQREETGYAADYFKMELDFIRSRNLTAGYPSAELHPPGALIIS